MKQLSFVLPLVLAILAVVGCDNRFDQIAEAPPPKPKTPTGPKVVIKNTAPSKPGKRSKQPPREALEVISRAYDSTRDPARLTGGSEELAIKHVTAAVRASLELGPTLIVWVIDRTPSAQKLVASATTAAEGLYDNAQIRELAPAGGQQLLSAIVAFDDKAEFLLDPPSPESQKAKDALGKIEPSSSGRELTFAAVKQALDKYLAYRTDAANRREVVIVLVTDEAGDDQELADELADLVKRHAVPIYCLGSPAPWGQVNPFAPNPKKLDSSKSDDSMPTYGPETLASERVDLEMPRSSGGYRGNSENFDLIDSGFGPFALERLCRAGGGEFLAIRPEGGSRYSFGSQTTAYWPTGGELRFETDKVARYAPEYVSVAEHNKLLAQNKARQALVQAAQLPPLRIDGSPDMRFPKSNEAQMKRTLDKAQQFAAKNSPNIDRLYESLAPSEGDRAKLPTPRLQAEFDLALGRVLAAKARIDGYNSMIAALKRGKTFTNASSNVWNLEPADAYETESTIKKLAERAKTYLQRVVKDHAGTPWAKIAEAELAVPMGWTWKES